jgi:aryl-alcohol dehydrogenase-like predicted oxidoreductase
MMAGQKFLNARLEMTLSRLSVLGAWAGRLSSGPYAEEESLKVLSEAADMGINFWITSDYYGPFTSEKLLGRWFKETGRRDEIFLATHFGNKIVDGKVEIHGEPDYVKKSCEASLERL